MSRLSNIAGVILAAGQSSRMGKVKQLLPFRGKTILQWVIDNALASSLERIIVVIGHRADLVEPAITGRDVTVVINDYYRKGQSSSIKAGLQALPEGTEAVLFMLGDQPLVAPETINHILNAYVTFQNPIVLPLYKGKRGNPALFSRETFHGLESLTEDCGGRSLLKEYDGKVLQLEVYDPYIHFDLDTDEDYRRLLKLEAE
ncbi:MAG: molybdenum cofactor cytidylyltransferase [Desulfuromonadaceae bacterium]|nr:molybdenum cofactor cytidylyltransferase [Desulfuromonadaceae bacterium]